VNRHLMVSWLVLYIAMLPIAYIVGGFFSWLFYTMYCLILLRSPTAPYSLSKSPASIVCLIGFACGLLIYRSQMRSTPPDPLLLLKERRYSELERLYRADWYNRLGFEGASPLAIVVSKEADSATQMLLAIGVDPRKAWLSDESRVKVLKLYATPFAREQIERVLEDRK